MFATMHLIAKDRDCADTIANNVERFQNCDADVLIKAFMACPDPDRRLFFARNSAISIRLLKQLSKDPDPSVANDAQQRLTNRH
jgi:hypothetical protein